MEGLWRRMSGGTVQITATAWTNNPEKGGPPTFTLRIDPRASPATFDMDWRVGGVPYFRGIYKVKGDTLTICYNSAGEERPTSFDGPGKGKGTEVFTRVR